MTNEENAPMDATAMHAEAIIRAAIEWRFERGDHTLMNRAEWKLFEACNEYGDQYRGVRGR